MVQFYQHKANFIFYCFHHILFDVVLTVCLQQLLLGGDSEGAILSRQNHSQADVVLL